MPAHDATNPDSEAMMAATPMASISPQLQERQDRERRARALNLQHDYIEALLAMTKLAEQIRAQLRD